MSMVYLKMHVENVYIKCLIDYIKRIEEQRSLSAKIYTRDKRLNFRNYVLALFHEMAPSGKINQLLPKIIIPRIFQAYKRVKRIQASHDYPRIYYCYNDCRYVRTSLGRSHDRRLSSQLSPSKQIPLIPIGFEIQTIIC